MSAENIFSKLQGFFRNRKGDRNSELVKIREEKKLPDEALLNEIRLAMRLCSQEQASPAVGLNLPFFKTGRQLTDQFEQVERSRESYHPILAQIHERIASIRQAQVDQIKAMILETSALGEEANLTADKFRTITLSGDRFDLQEAVALLFRELVISEKNDTQSNHRAPFLFLGAANSMDVERYDELPGFSLRDIDLINSDSTQSLIEFAHLLIMAPAEFFQAEDSIISHIKDKIKAILGAKGRRMRIDYIALDQQPQGHHKSANNIDFQIRPLTLEQTIDNYSQAFRLLEEQLIRLGYAYNHDIFKEEENKYLARVGSAYEVSLGSRPLLGTLVETATALDTTDCFDQKVLVETLMKYLTDHGCGLKFPGDLKGDLHTLQALMLLSQQIDDQGNLNDDWEKKAFPFLEEKEARTLAYKLLTVLCGSEVRRSQNLNLYNPKTLIHRRRPGAFVPTGVDIGLVRLFARLRDSGFVPDRYLMIRPEAIGKLFAFICPRCGNQLQGITIDVSGQLNVSKATGCGCGSQEPPEIKYL